MIAYTANGFASNEINNLKDSNFNELSTNSVEEQTENFEVTNSGLCSTTTYGRYVTQYINEGTGMDGQPYFNVSIVWEITGQCKTCYVMGHSGVGTTTTWWGYGY